jgi:hypothetical protein
MRHRFLALPLAGLAVLTIVSAVMAGGWADVSVSNSPTDPSSGGGGTPIELRVLQHGVTPVSWPNLSVIATDAAGDIFRTKATAKGPAGTYVATLVFPKAGDWTLTFDSPELIMGGAVTMSVAPGVVAAPPVAQPPVVEPVAQPAAVTPTPAPAPASFDAMLVAVPLIAAIVVLAGLGLLMRRSGASAASRVTLRN